MIRKHIYAGLLLVLAVSAATAQTRTPPPSGDDPMAKPTEAGIRITPAMARIFAKAYAGHLTGSFGLDKAKSDEATEKIARRFMQMFHQMDGPGQELIERFMEEQLTAQTKGERAFIPRGFGKEFADRVQPLIPAIRELARGTTQDIRPMLPFKQQLKLAGEMMAFNTGIDAFEEKMKQWSSGQADPTRNPFDNEDREPKLDDQGQSTELKRARERAQSVIDKGLTDEWEKYVKDAKSFYGFDGSQSATADSVLRECIERADRVRSDPQWRTKYYRNRVWQSMVFQLPDGWGHPLRPLLEQEQEDMQASLKALGEDLRVRIDRIPTHAQRLAGEQRVESLLADKGVDVNLSTAPATTGGAQ